MKEIRTKTQKFLTDRKIIKVEHEKNCLKLTLDNGNVFTVSIFSSGSFCEIDWEYKSEECLDFGFEGPSEEDKKLLDIIKRAAKGHICPNIEGYRFEDDPDPIRIPKNIEDIEPCSPTEPSRKIFYMTRHYVGDKDEVKVDVINKPKLLPWQTEMIKDLRQRTARGMMECKKALEENYWDFYAALEYLKEQPLHKVMPQHGYKKED